MLFELYKRSCLFSTSLSIEMETLSIKNKVLKLISTKARQHRLPFRDSNLCSKEVLEMIHSDLMYGPIKTMSVGGLR